MESDEITVHLNQNERSSFRQSSEDIITETALGSNGLLTIRFSRPVSIRNVVLLKVYGGVRRVEALLSESQIEAKYVFKHNLPLDAYQMLYRTTMAHAGKGSTLLVEFIIRPGDVAAIGSVAEYRRMTTREKLHFLYSASATDRMAVDLNKCNLRLNTNYGLSIECYDFELQLQYIAEIDKFIVCHSSIQEGNQATGTRHEGGGIQNKAVFSIRDYLDATVSDMTRSDSTTSTNEMETLSELTTAESTQLETEPDEISSMEESSCEKMTEIVAQEKPFKIAIGGVDVKAELNEKCELNENSNTDVVKLPSAQVSLTTPKIQQVLERYHARQKNKPRRRVIVEESSECVQICSRVVKQKKQRLYNPVNQNKYAYYAKKQAVKLITIVWWVYFVAFFLVPGIRQKTAGMVEDALQGGIVLYQKSKRIHRDLTEFIKEKRERKERVVEVVEEKVEEDVVSEVVENTVSEVVEETLEPLELPETSELPELPETSEIPEIPEAPTQPELPEPLSQPSQPTQPESTILSPTHQSDSAGWMILSVCVIIPALAYNCMRDIRRIKLRQAAGYYDIRASKY
ncbi:hypothetical protein ECANGB1_1003 [Enterospora canceri]|uniref:Uncharacterized protein n=1 Tax=Enterospora canceri TaxID=1081671 RepID=A0A1Y1S6Y6_9MICR|nr:hypothetical protein ECANGB1_1003 [Enterospora canceri]